MITANAKSQAPKLTLTAESKDGKAYVRIIGRISDYNDNNSKAFQKLVDELVKKHSDCEVYINSQGGSVFEATEINNQLKRFKNVTVTVGALAASAATYFIACYPTTVSMNTQIMIHRPMLGTYGNEDEIMSQLKLLQNITKDYLSKYAAKTGKTVEEITALWSKGDYWMSATEAKADGFVDFIDDEVDAVTAEDVLLLEACGAPIIPKVTAVKEQTKPKNTNIMTREEEIAFFGLEASATDEQINAARNAMKVDALKQRNAVKDLTEKEKEDAAAKVTALVNKGVAEKKFKATEAPNYTKLATADYESTEKIIAAMPTLPKLTDEINPSAEGKDTTARANWTLDDYLEQDPEAYEKMLVDEPKKAKELEAAYLAKK